MFFGKKKRYLGGLRPKKYFETEILPTMGDIFSILDIDQEHQFSFFELFMSVDNGSGGSVDLEEFHAFFQVKRTKFSDRVFAVIDVQDKGELDFKQFAIGINIVSRNTLLRPFFHTLHIRRLRMIVETIHGFQKIDTHCLVDFLL